MKATNTKQQYFLIVDKVSGMTHKIDIKPNQGVISQVNKAYDDYIKEEKI